MLCPRTLSICKKSVGFYAKRSLSGSLASDPNSLVIRTFDEDSRICTLSLNKPPVNSLTTKFMQEITANLNEVSKNTDSIKGLVLTSNLKRVFCAGLDLKSLYKQPENKIKCLVQAAQIMSLTLYTLPLPVVAAINGHAMAGGICLLTQADHRIMTDDEKFKIGFNETRFGTSVPPSLFNSYKILLGEKRAEIHLKKGTLFSPSDALEVGLVEELSPNEPDLLMKMANRVIEEFYQIVALRPNVFQETKLEFRQETAEKMKERFEMEATKFAKIYASEEVQNSVGKYVQAMENRPK